MVKIFIVSILVLLLLGCFPVERKQEKTIWHLATPVIEKIGFPDWIGIYKGTIFKWDKPQVFMYFKYEERIPYIYNLGSYSEYDTNKERKKLLRWLIDTIEEEQKKDLLWEESFYREKIDKNEN